MKNLLVIPKKSKFFRVYSQYPDDVIPFSKFCIIFLYFWSLINFIIICDVDPPKNPPINPPNRAPRTYIKNYIIY